MHEGSFFRSVPGLILIVATLALGASLPLAFGLIHTEPLGLVAGTIFALIFFLGVPLALIRYVYKERAADYGWQLPPRPAEACLYGAVVLVLLCIPLAFLADSPQFTSYYRIEGYALPEAFFFVFLLTSIYFVAEEFMFRGFFFFALKKKVGVWAVAVDALVFGLLHFGKPHLEMYIAFFAAASLSFLTLRTNSALPAAVVHFLMATFFTVYITLFK